MLRTLFNSDFFKRAQFAKVKSPAEMVAGAARQSGGFAFPDVEDIQLALQTGNMGQMLVDPPSVEGWHTGPGVGHDRQPRQPRQLRSAAVRRRHEAGSQIHHRARPVARAEFHARANG